MINCAKSRLKIFYFISLDEPVMLLKPWRPDIPFSNELQEYHKKIRKEPPEREIEYLAARQ
jgi:hypothetical protein